MCTVTFIPSKENIFLTSNRDEKHWRTSAKVPEAYSFRSGKIIFPKDGDAGGTWFAIHENGNAIVFLNGGFFRHTPEPPYRKSRGLVLLELIDSDSPLLTFQNTDLNNIEPFTAVIVDGNRLFECRWDGKEKHEKGIDKSIPHIWSSCTLYDEEVVARRKAWFTRWLENHPAPSQEEILHFHQFTGEGDMHNDLRMNRDGKVFTVSVTSAAIGSMQTIIEYVDLQHDSQVSQTFGLKLDVGGN